MAFIIGIIIIIAIIMIIFKMIRDSENEELKIFIVLLISSGGSAIAGSLFDDSRIDLLTKGLFVGAIVMLIVSITKALFK